MKNFRIKLRAKIETFIILGMTVFSIATEILTILLQDIFFDVS